MHVHEYMICFKDCKFYKNCRTRKKGLMFMNCKKYRKELLRIREMNNQEAMEKHFTKEMKKITDSDLFDSAMVGNDISNEEFVDNEKWFARFD